MSGTEAMGPGGVSQRAVEALRLDDVSQAAVEALGPDDVSQAASVLREALFDDPLVRHVLGSSHDYAARLNRLVTSFVTAGMLRDDVVLWASGTAGLDAVAVAAYPDVEGGSSALTHVRDETWVLLGTYAKERHAKYVAATEQLVPDTTHLRLSMLGVRRAEQGKGHEEGLLEAVHELSLFTAGSTGVSVTTALESSLPFYESHGYKVTGRVEAASGLKAWGLYRRNR